MANIIYVIGLIPIPGLNVTPIAFVLTGLVSAWALTSQRLLDLVPIARDALIEQLDEGALVFDAQWRLVDYNPAAQHMSGVRRAHLGHELTTSLPAIATPIVLSLNRGEPCHLELAEPPFISLELRTTPLARRDGQNLGWLVLLRDVSVQERAEQTLRSFFDSVSVLMPASKPWPVPIASPGSLTGVPSMST